MKHTNIIAALFGILTLPLAAQQKVSDRISLTAAALAPGTDILPIVDISAGLAGSKKITIDDLFTGWGFTTAGKALATGASAAAQRTSLGLGTAATQATTAFEAALGNPAANGYLLSSTTAGVRTWVIPPSGGGLVPANNLSDLTNFATARTNLGLAIGSAVQAWDADLDGWAAKIAPGGAVVGASDTQTLTAKTLTSPVINLTGDATGDLYYRDSAGAFTRLPIGAAGNVLKVAAGLPSWAASPGGGDLLATNNLSDLTNAATARSNLGLGTAATQASTAFEATLGNPAANGYLLSSTTAGVRTWVIPPSGGGLVPANNLSDLTNFATARTNLGLAIGTNVQAWDADLDAWAGKTAPGGTVVGTSDTQTLTAKTLTSPVINVTSDATGDLYYRSSAGAFTRLGIGSAGNVLTVASGLPSWAAGGGGGLANFTDAVNSSAPNATVPAASLTATNAASNVDAIISPKGSGAFLAVTPDNTTAGGNKRGTYAVDLQRSRIASTQVASGTYAIIGGGANNSATASYSVIAGGENNTASSAGFSAVSGGKNNTASGLYSVVAGGFQNPASGNYSMIGGGTTNTASGQSSVVSGGDSNVASSSQASIGGGYSNLASGGSSTISGGDRNTAAGNCAAISGGLLNVASGDFSTARGAFATARGIHGVDAKSGGQFAATGDAQSGTYILRRSTGDATQAELTANGLPATGTTRITLPNNATYSFTGQLSARSSAGDSAAWRFAGTIERGANAAATTLLGVSAADTHSEAGSSAWTIAVDADTTNGSLRLRVTGAAATTIRWVAGVETVEVTH